MRKLILLASILLLAACDKADEKYSTVYPVNFHFDMSLHVGTYLSSIVENANYFVIVSREYQTGKQRLTVTPNDGNSVQTIDITTDREQYLLRQMGSDNRLIIGCLFGMFDVNDNVYSYIAYDGQCRFCLDTYNMNRFPLTFTHDGHSVECANCHRQYSLNTGASTDGYLLYTYKAQYDDGTKVLTVTNR
jgi:hypothetical protein